jgi:cytochrome b involved in lipid metabolism
MDHDLWNLYDLKQFVKKHPGEPVLAQRYAGGDASRIFPEADCRTIAPQNLQILKTQLRRWINSTLHNRCEMLKVQTMCGVCMFP